MLNGLHGHLRQMEHEIKLNIQPTKTNIRLGPTVGKIHAELRLIFCASKLLL